MREIKFRAWDKYRKTMLEVLGIFFDFSYIKHKPLRLPDNIAPFNNNDGYNNTDIADVVLMQYTGLHDKQGKEIFEGDIIKQGDSVGEVYYSEIKAQFVIDGAGGGRQIDKALPVTPLAEIIGNPHENPELLKK